MMRMCFPGGHPEIQVILLGGEDTSGKICEGAGRTIGFVEVNKYLAIGFHVCYKVASGGVGIFLAGWV